MTETGAGPAKPQATKKSEWAFGTISEVASELDLPQHVLRYWETKFNAIKPMRRGGGRRFYRPGDVALLRQISSLLYDDGYTIKGVQKVLRDSGGRKGASSATAKGDEKPPEGGETLAVSETPIGALKRRELEAVVQELEALQELLTRRKR